LQFKLDFDGKRDKCLVPVDPIALSRVLSNLINNAVEASREAGSVTISLKDNGSHLLLKISDRGKGIPAQILSRLGERHFTFDKVNGSGLGVAHAKECVQGWGGTFSVASQVGVGTEVVLQIPTCTTSQQISA
jgi:two-component system, sporulation sensor kinase E